VIEKFKHLAEFVDVEARNSFRSKEIIVLVIKCAHGYNHYGTRDAMINGKLTEKECPRCSEIEMWDHVIQCKEVKPLQ